MNPWKIIGWIVLALLLLTLYRCYAVVQPAYENRLRETGQAPAQAAPRHEFTVDSFTCEQVASTTRVKVMGRNTGSTRIEYAQAFFLVGEESLTPYFRPDSIGPGALASAHHIARRHGQCQLVGMQDRHGNPVTLK